MNENLDLYDELQNEEGYYPDAEINKNIEEKKNNIILEVAKVYLLFAFLGILTYEEMQKNNKLIRLNKEIIDIVKTLFETEKDIISRGLDNIIQKAYISEANNIFKSTGIVLTKDLLNQKELDQISNMPISGLTYLERIEKNKQDTFMKIKETIVSNLIRGSDQKTMNKEIEIAINKSVARELNILANEAHRVENAGINQLYGEAKKQGISIKKIWNAVMDSKTRDAHTKLNNTVANKDGYFIFDGNKAQYPGGFGIASLDINCRCKLSLKVET